MGPIQRHRALGRDDLPDVHMSPIDTATPGTYGAKQLWPMAKVTAGVVTAVLVSVILGVLQKAGVALDVDLGELVKDVTAGWVDLGSLRTTARQAINAIVPLAVAYLWPRSPVDNVPVHDPLERIPPDTVED